MVVAGAVLAVIGIATSLSNAVLMIAVMRLSVSSKRSASLSFNFFIGRRAVPMTDSQPSTTHRLMQWLGLQQKTIDLKELIVAAAGSVIAITVVFFVSDYLPHGDHLLIVASTGASAVLIFAVPHGRLSQPWPVIAGHCVCATIGVAFAQWIGTGPETAALTVGRLHRRHEPLPLCSSACRRDRAHGGSRRTGDLGAWLSLCAIACADQYADPCRHRRPLKSAVSIKAISSE